ncbi:trimethylamine methyltransferase family protein [Chloroflexota bacterium]
MRHNYVHYGSPQFRVLSDSQLEELHLAVLQILERTGVSFTNCQEALRILGEAGADISNPDRVKIPSYLVEQALRTAPKTITLYSRDGEPAMVLNGMTGSHFGGIAVGPHYLDPYTRKPRLTYAQDIADAALVVDALPNLEWIINCGIQRTVPDSIAEVASLLQVIRNTSKPIAVAINEVSGIREMIELCSIVAGGEEQLRKKPFLIGSSEPVSPLTQEKEAVEISLICAEKGIPNFVYSMPLAGATTPATWPGVLVIPTAEFLSQLVVIQLKYPGAPVIFGSMPNIMDMKTTIYPYGAPELSLLVAALTEMVHCYGLPMLGTAGCTDADMIGAQAAAEATYGIFMSALSGADFVHDVGLMYHGTMASPELTVLCDEIIGMVKVSMGGIEINEDTLPLDLIEKKGPRANYISEKHTLKHFRNFWAPKLFDRSVTKKGKTGNCEELVNKDTIKILETHQPKPLPDDVLKELKKVEADWFKRAGIKEYSKKS